MALAHLLEEMYDPVKTLKLFQLFSAEELKRLEKSWADEVADVIGKTEAQRPAVLRRIQREHPGQRVPELVLLYAIMGQARTYKALELRDNYRAAMAAGGGNRATCEAWYQFTREIAELNETYEFPFEVFEAYGAAIDWDEGSDEDSPAD